MSHLPAGKLPNDILTLVDEFLTRDGPASDAGDIVFQGNVLEAIAPVVARLAGTYISIRGH